MSTSRRDVLKQGFALAAVPLVGRIDPAAKFPFTTGFPELDAALGGGIKAGSFVAVVGARGAGKTAFLLRLAKANGVADAHPMSSGQSDMLSIMKRPDGTYVGSLMLDSAEPATDQEKQQMKDDPAARDAFLCRWFRRTQEVVRESGGLFVVSAPGTENTSGAQWFAFPDYVIAAQGGTYRVIKGG